MTEHATPVGPRLLSISLVLAALSSGSSYGATGKCYLQVDGKVYIDNPCNIELEHGGSFSIGTDDPKSRYFAYVELYDGKATGSWNGVDAESHAHDPLGDLTRHGACWTNNRAKVCAWY